MVENVALEEKQLVVFNLDKEAYAIDIVVVTEIIQMQPITRVPGTPKSVVGVINLRGSIIPVVDLRAHFHLEKYIVSNDTRIIVVHCKGQDVGVIVDSMSKVIRVPVDLIEPAANLFTSEKQDYLMGVAKLPKGMVIWLDMEKVLAKHDIQVVGAGELMQTNEHNSKSAKTPEGAAA